MSLNRVILIGRLGRDPETRYTGSGQAVCNFSIATDESWTGKSGEKQKHTEWHKLVVWGKQADVAQKYLKKGNQVCVEGKIQSREWQDREGAKRTSFEINVSRITLLSGNNPRPEDEDAPQDTSDAPGPEVTDEDIPF